LFFDDERQIESGSSAKMPTALASADMRKALFLLLASTVTTAQQPLGPGWVPVLPGKSVYANRDSIWKIGPGAYRAVIITDLMPGFRNIDTDEIRCAEHTARTVRSRAVGSHVRSGRGDVATPSEPFEKVYLGGPADLKYQAVCALAGTTADPPPGDSPRVAAGNHG
jgi:hypothetical protein